MTNKILEEMAREYESGAHKSNAEAMRAALLWLAAEESEALAEHVCCAIYNIPHGHAVPSPMLDGMTDAIAAALRQAAGETK